MLYIIYQYVNYIYQLLTFKCYQRSIQITWSAYKFLKYSIVSIKYISYYYCLACWPNLHSGPVSLPP